MSFVTVNADNNLVIRDVQEADAGHYRCRASNEAGSAEAFITMEVGGEYKMSCDRDRTLKPFFTKAGICTALVIDATSEMKVV